MKYEITLGADPESMVQRIDDGKIVSAIPVIGTNKKKPIDLGDGIKFYADNVLAELAFPPSSTIDGFISTIGLAFNRAAGFLIERGPGHRLLHRAAHIYGDDELGAKPEIMEGILPESWEIGCNPSWDAYARSEKFPIPFKDGLRTGSFHLHIGHPMLAGGHEKMPIKAVAVMLLDIFVGCASVIFDKDPHSKARRALYGRAGDFRSTPYGIEWRVLGNYALGNQNLVRLVWDAAFHAIEHVENGTAKDVLSSVSSDMVQEAINESNKTLSEEVLRIARLPGSIHSFLNLDYRTNRWSKQLGVDA